MHMLILCANNFRGLKQLSFWEGFMTDWNRWDGGGLKIQGVTLTTTIGSLSSERSELIGEPSSLYSKLFTKEKISKKEK